MAELEDLKGYANLVHFTQLDEANHTCNIKSAHSVGQTQGGATLSFCDINYAVAKKKRRCCGPTVTKQILKRVNGICRPGMNVILGPTGSGKTSLLDVLAWRKDPKEVTGQLLIDGHTIPQNFKCMVGYVVQEDYMMPTLTVRENMMFSANLRLPASFTFADRVQRVEDLIQELGLSDCAKTKVIIAGRSLLLHTECQLLHVLVDKQHANFGSAVGDEFIRGISGGEKKRTNIGMELVMSPPLLFLDEPTTGLDAATAYAVMVMLKKLALSGRTIIFSIHQPRFSIFKLFDELTLLSKGDVVYQGPAKDTLGYFQKMGYICEEHNNPSDFFLDVVNGDSMLVQQYGINIIGDITSECVTLSEKDRMDLQIALVNCYQESPGTKMLLADLKEISHDYQTRDVSDVTVKPVSYKASGLRQFLIISKRAVKMIGRTPETLYLQVFTSVVLALLGGAIFYQLSDESAIQNRRGALFYIVGNWIFNGVSAFQTFVQNRAIFIHENSNGYYTVSSYCLANLVCDIIPMRFVRSVVYSAITYWMIGFRPDVDVFFTYILVIFLAQMAACAIAFAVGASVRSFSIGTSLISLLYIFMMGFSGLLIQLDTMSDWISWFKYFSIFRYGYEAVSILELKDRSFCGSRNNSTPIVMCAGNAHLTSQGIGYATDWDFWSHIVALSGITIACLLLTYIQLLRMKKVK